VISIIVIIIIIFDRRKNYELPDVQQNTGVFVAQVVDPDVAVIEVSWLKIKTFSVFF